MKELRGMKKSLLTNLHRDRNFKIIQKLVDKNDFILDIGTSDGLLLNYFNGVGIDVTSERFESSGNMVVNDVEKSFSFKDEIFDVCVASHIIEHLDNYEMLIKECYRVLKKHGKIIILTPEWYSDYVIKICLKLRLLTDIDHKNISQKKS
ncbi:MAG: class I SAM-dependent methyltransferase [Methanocellales archaeon]|nr:class I SAM-dependent methyltransferase [Methanocellales archaeon]